MDNLDLSSKLNFDDIDLTDPNIVVEELAAQIEKETNGIVKGSVEPYSGHVISYKKSSLAGLQAVLGTVEQEVDIQDSLGKIGEKTAKYEFYLSTPSFEQYKYRLCFIQFGVANYPVLVVLEQSIADSINKRDDSNYIISCNNRKELENLIIKIILSKRIINIMQELIHINQIHCNQINDPKGIENLDENDYLTERETLD